MSKTIVVIGGANGGPVAAARIRSFAEDARIILLEKRNHVSWVQAGLRFHLEGKVGRLEDLDVERSSFFEKRYRIEVRTGAEVVALDSDSQRVVVRTSEGLERIKYDSVVFSGGAVSKTLPIPGLEGDRVCNFRNLDDLRTIQKAVDAGAKHAVIIGCGAFGLDAAEGLLAAGFTMDIVESASRILPGFSFLASRAAAKELIRDGVTLRLEKRIERLEDHAQGGKTVFLDDGTSIEAGLVVVAAGMRPRTELLKDQASLNADGSVRTNRQMETTLRNVYACGTAVSVQHAVTHGHLWVPQAAIIDQTAQVAGRNAALAANRSEQAKEGLNPVAGTIMHKVNGMWIARTGLSADDARKAFCEGEHDRARIQVNTVHAWAGEAWLEKCENICVRIVVDKERDVVVGGEVWGRRGVPRRIDILAAAVLDGWAPSRVADLDIAYDPTLGPAYDPINACGTLAGAVKNGEVTTIDATTLTDWIKTKADLQIVDVGKGSKTDKAIAPKQTVNIPLEELRERTSELDPQKPLVLVSHTGRRAQLASRVLSQRGFCDVVFLDGGLITWSLWEF
ncbi:MAG: FAD-dependent oxidoreductase [Deltaproteobacteria bacterium]|nr:FAD-dependent oxidoreductase [Deltaproteobacteria bacterium]